MNQNISSAFCLALAFGAVALADTSGTGVVAAPTAAAYADLRNASNKMLADLKLALPAAKTIILYDAATFSAVPYYNSTTDLVRTAAANLCGAESASLSPRAIVPTVDIGTAAQGLASLLQITLPTYAIQGQNLTLDTGALIGSFATAAKDSGYTVINPTYLLPAVSQKNLTCSDFRSSNSLADLWKFVNGEAIASQPKAATKKPLKDALDSFSKMKDVLLTSTDKGPPLLGRALMVESIARSVAQPSQVAVIDMHLDAADIDSTTKTILWWRKTKFSANVAAHYWIFATKGTGSQFGIVLVEPGYVNILSKNMDVNRFAVNH